MSDGPVALRDLRITKITCADAYTLVIKQHYLHRRGPCSFAFGLFHGTSLLGVITYGTPSSAPLRRGICGEEEAGNVIELTRLWISDDAPKNSESYLIGNTLGQVDKEIIVSYADPEQGHVGTVYQATNWIYTGLSAKRTDWAIKGITKHGQTLADKYTAKEIREKYGDDFSLKQRSRKHRYVYFNCNRRRRRELLKKLRYPVREYPKKEYREEG